MIAVRCANPSDLQLIARLIRELADYERLLDELRFDEAELDRHLFGDTPRAEVLIGEIDSAPRGFALFFHTFSTVEGRPGL